MLISSIFQTKEDGGQMDSELRVRTTYVSGSGIGIHFTLRIQSPRKKFVCGCEKFLPGSAWLLLSEQVHLCICLLHAPCCTFIQIKGAT